MGYYIKETVGDVTVEIGYNTLEELQARLKEIEPKHITAEAVKVESIEPCEPERPEEHKGSYLVYWPGAEEAKAWIHDSLQLAMDDINESIYTTPRLYELGREIPLKRKTIIENPHPQLGKALTRWELA